VRYSSNGFDTIDAANIMHAARIFATRFAHQKYGPKGRYRTTQMGSGLRSRRPRLRRARVICGRLLSPVQGLLRLVVRLAAIKGNDCLRTV
jgi:hypothetical protein